MLQGMLVGVVLGAATSAGATSLFVMEVDPSDAEVSDEMRAGVNQALDAAARGIEGLKVQSKRDFAAAAEKDASAQQCGEESAACAAQIARLANTELVLVSRLGQVADVTVLSLAVFDAKTQAFSQRVVAPGRSQAQVREAVEAAVRAALSRYAAGARSDAELLAADPMRKVWSGAAAAAAVLVGWSGAAAIGYLALGGFPVVPGAGIGGIVVNTVTASLLVGAGTFAARAYFSDLGWTVIATVGAVGGTVLIVGLSSIYGDADAETAAVINPILTGAGASIPIVVSMFFVLNHTKPAGRAWADEWSRDAE